MSYAIHKQTYADGRAYRYDISDETGHVHYVAEPTGLRRPLPTRLIEFFDPDHNLAGRLQPPEIAPWRRAARYEVFVGQESAEPYAVIQEQLRLVDILLLRMPRYEVQLGTYRYIVQGSRYGECLYEIFRRLEGEMEKADAGQPLEGQGNAKPESELSETRIGQIQCPPTGPSYVVETDATPLRQAMLVLAALVILIDVERYA